MNRLRSRTGNVVVAAALVSGLVAGMVIAVAPSAAVDLDPPPTTAFSDIELTLGSSRLTGTQTTSLDVQVHLTDVDAQRYWQGIGPVSCDPRLLLRRYVDGSTTYRGQSSQARSLELHRKSGTDADGIWQATTRLGAVDAGEWRPTSICAGDLSQGGPEGPWWVPIDPEIAAAAAVQLDGSDAPRLSLKVQSTPTDPGEPYLVRARLVLSDSRKPVEGAFVALGYRYCYKPFEYADWTEVRKRTNANGWVRMRSPAVSLRWCAGFGRDGTGAPLQVRYRDTPNHIRTTVRAWPVRRKAPAGAAIRVNGRLDPTGHGCWGRDEGARRVRLQRFSKHTWRTVGKSMSSDLDGRFRLQANPPEGKWKYRVRSKAKCVVLAGTSRTFTVVGR